MANKHCLVTHRQSLSAFPFSGNVIVGGGGCVRFLKLLNATDPANSLGHVLSEISIVSCDRVEHFQFRTVEVTKV